MARMIKELEPEVLAGVAGGEIGEQDQQVLDTLMQTIKERGGTIKDAVTVWRSSYNSDPEIMNYIRQAFCRNLETVRLRGSVV